MSNKRKSVILMLVVAGFFLSYIQGQSSMTGALNSRMEDINIRDQSISEYQKLVASLRTELETFQEEVDTERVLNMHPTGAMAFVADTPLTGVPVRYLANNRNNVLTRFVCMDVDVSGNGKVVTDLQGKAFGVLHDLR